MISTIELPPAFQYVIMLGQPLRLYRPARGLIVVIGFACAVFVLLGIGMILYGLVLYPRAFADAPSIEVTIAGGILMLLPLALATNMLWRSTEAAVLYRDGLAHFNGKVVIAVKWEEIASLTMMVTETRMYGVISIGRLHDYTLITLSGKKIKLDGTLAKVEDLVNEIREHSLPHILARSRQAFDAGQMVAFGPISIGKTQGIEWGKNRYAWEDIGQISLSKGEVAIKPKKRGLFRAFCVPVPQVPNVDVFLALGAEMAEQQKQTA